MSGFHGTTQAILGLGDGSVIGTNGNTADADNTLDALVTAEVLASEITITDSAGDYAASTVEDALAEVADNGRTVYSALTADSADVNASVTLVASGLSCSVLPGTYVLDAAVLVTTAAAADISLKWGGTATVTATVGVSDIFYVNGPHSGSDATVAAIPVLFPTSWTTETEAMFATTGALADTPLVFKGKLVVTVAGTIILQFTQGTSDASNTHIDKGSYLLLTKVA